MNTRILLIGAGAIGCLVASRLKNCTIHLVARSNAKFIKSNGIQVQSTVYGDYTKTNVTVHSSIADKDLNGCKLLGLIK